ncbi:site-specific integrase [Modicisalibacter sp. MOD 31.J]|uniref:tyrosine-type recombinase/integrase n=1 Tax=Modicisalibacter sp. MOD 31.J TaxID=2831897 RepID=UPI001CCD3C28|nr:site-specific integrase [Modicisalibacter sp. MOD 31.J]MBZ9576766.1 site-specific integrase [Modicisalibacter sp. MOD 31.J]
MATFQKRSGSWRAIVRKKGYPQVSATFDTKAQAERWAKQIETEMAQSRFIDTREADALTIAAALERYEREISVHKKSYRNERSRLAILKRDLGNYTLTSLRSSDVAAYRDQRLEVASGSTVRRDLALLSHLYTIALKEWGMPVDNPCAKIRKPKLNNDREQRVSDAELGRILQAARERHAELASLITLAVESGMRRSEILELRRENVKGSVAYLADTKNGSARAVPLSSVARAAIGELPSRLDGRLFSLRPDTVTHYFAKCCKDAGVAGLRFHDLRHEATSRFFERGLNIMEVAAITGHKDLRMLRRYTHLNPSALAEKLG